MCVCVCVCVCVCDIYDLYVANNFTIGDEASLIIRRVTDLVGCITDPFF